MEFSEKMKHLFNLSDESIYLLFEHFEEVPYPKGHIILKEGQRNDYVYFVKTGLLRASFLREGKDITFMFAFDGDMIIHTAGRIDKTISGLTTEALEDTLLLRISQKHLESLFNTSIELANWGRKLAEKGLSDYEYYFREFYWEDKTTQYLSLIKEYPQLLQRVPLNKLASYLNITPQSLSRIRANRND